MTESRQRQRGAAAWLGIAVVAAWLPFSARADQIFSDTDQISGTTVIRTVQYTFSVSGPGALVVALTDDIVPGTAWQAPLADFGVTITNASSLIGQITGAGQATFDVASAGTLYAYVTGEATNLPTGPAYGVGLYNLTVSFTPLPVPLPASPGLLLAALPVVGLLQLRRRRFDRFPNAPPQSV
ncbi:MAG TPA: hypothetical protein VMC02_02570 [Steroidobacteraceae bacterium]|nr:hypothetical protein [Steroidobacteraceae bacterium]